ncbi:hypothetical protein M408DRAFT_30084 [Serendipita vermifera MAFF 305830]|uniref:Uncharacterized protein n=1 Tax=Serendipita vermifera MAFF 305830 TaxID=933852 RepID=A0A0C3AL66_SERVB|nr:hypothetical protein M408DRAFT_30084 [Serendipita vermifera MAFF 305830]
MSSQKPQSTSKRVLEAKDASVPSPAEQKLVNEVIDKENVAEEAPGSLEDAKKAPSQDEEPDQRKISPQRYPSEKRVQQFNKYPNAEAGPSNPRPRKRKVLDDEYVDAAVRKRARTSRPAIVRADLLPDIPAPNKVKKSGPTDKSLASPASREGSGTQTDIFGDLLNLEDDRNALAAPVVNLVHVGDPGLWVLVSPEDESSTNPGRTDMPAGELDQMLRERSAFGTALLVDSVEEDVLVPSIVLNPELELVWEGLNLLDFPVEDTIEPFATSIGLGLLEDEVAAGQEEPSPPQPTAAPSDISPGTRSLPKEAALRISTPLCAREAARPKKKPAQRGKKAKAESSGSSKPKSGLMARGRPIPPEYLATGTVDVQSLLTRTVPSPRFTFTLEQERVFLERVNSGDDKAAIAMLPNELKFAALETPDDIAAYRAVRPTPSGTINIEKRLWVCRAHFKVKLNGKKEAIGIQQLPHRCENAVGSRDSVVRHWKCTHLNVKRVAKPRNKKEVEKETEEEEETEEEDKEDEEEIGEDGDEQETEE